MSELNLCPKCQRPLGSSAPHELCPACLLGAMITEGGDSLAERTGDETELDSSPDSVNKEGAGEVPAMIPAPNETAGERIGRYKLLQQIGEGGFGTVWMAEQVEPVTRMVALKIIKLGMDTREVIVRFEAERQALAMMDHPNIAKVFDAGATDKGRPFFVMELVRGIPITRFCDEQQFGTKERLLLFGDVCSAINHAHQKGIIHRDIKPSNVMVTLHGDKPVVKVIDFGIAKATQGKLTDKTLFTKFDQFIGTPVYMSPEQAALSGLDIDTRSDIYALGILLYELLTGKPPFDAKSLLSAGHDEMRRIIREVEPVKPSSRLSTIMGDERTLLARARQIEPDKLSRTVEPDLDWIVMKAIEKDRTRRYETANGLALDIQRFLADEPVSAAAPSAAYRFSKFARRNRTALGVAGGFAAVLLAATGVSAWQAVRATRAEELAKERVVEVAAERDAKDAARRDAERNATQAGEEKENTRRALAKAQIALAEAAYREQDGSGMKAPLEATPADLRESSWDYLFKHADTSLASAKGQGVGAAAIPGRAGIFVVADLHDGITVVNAVTGERLSQFKPTPGQSGGWVRGVAVSPDGGRVAFGALAGAGIAIYDLRDGKPLIEWAAPDTDTLEFSDDGSRLLQASSIDGQTCLWDAATGRRIWTLPSSGRAVFEPSGAQVITARGADMVVLNALDGTILRTLPRAQFPGVSAMAMHPRGKLVVTGGPGGYIRGLDLAEGRSLFEFHAHDGYVRFLEFSPDGERFASVAELAGQGQSIHVWDSATGVRIQSLLGGFGRAEGFRIHPLSEELLLSGYVTKSWSLARPRPAWTLPGVSAAAFPGSDEVCLSLNSGNGSVASYTLGKQEPALAWNSVASGFRIVSVSANGRCAVAGAPGDAESRVQIISNPGGVPVETHVLQTRFTLGFMRLSPDGGRLLTFVGVGPMNHCFDTATGAVLPGLELTDLMQINDAAWLDGGRVAGLVTARRPRSDPRSEEWLVLWDAATGLRLLHSPNSSLMNCLAAAPGGHRLAEAGVDKMIRIRDATTLAVVHEFRAHDASITALAWHPDRPLLASASADLTVKIWNPDSGECLEEWRGFVKNPTTLQFSPTGRRLLTAGGGPARIWEPKSVQ